MNAYADSPRDMFVLCIKTVLILFLLDLACVLFRPVPFEINRAIMRDWRGGRVSSQKRTAKENAIKERVVRELRVPNWRSDGYGQ